MIKKMNIGKSIEMFNDSQKINNCIMIVYGEYITLPNVYIWDESLNDEIKNHFDEAIIKYSNNSFPTLLFYTNKEQKEVQWLLDLINNCKYIKDYVFYCKKDKENINAE